MGFSFFFEICLGYEGSLMYVEQLRTDMVSEVWHTFFIIHKWIICFDLALPSFRRIPHINSCVVGAEKGPEPRKNEKRGGVGLGVGAYVTDEAMSCEYILQANKMLITFLLLDSSLLFSLVRHYQELKIELFRVKPGRVLSKPPS